MAKICWMKNSLSFCQCMQNATISFLLLFVLRKHACSNSLFEFQSYNYCKWKLSLLSLLLVPEMPFQYFCHIERLSPALSGYSYQTRKPKKKKKKTVWHWIPCIGERYIHVHVWLYFIGLFRMMGNYVNQKALIDNQSIDLMVGWLTGRQPVWLVSWLIN